MRQNNQSLWELIEPVVNGMGFQVAEIEYVAHAKSHILRVYIDHENGVNIDDCGKVSTQLSGVLDVEEPISGHYSLEVSSPGLDRPLRKAADFERFSGQIVKIKMATPVGDRRNFKGTLLGITDNIVSVEVDGETYELSLGGIEKARIVPVF